MEAEIVKVGIWLYDNLVEKPVDVIALKYDYWYELYETDGLLEPDDKPEKLGPEGKLYYVRFQSASEQDVRFSPDSEGFQTIEKAMLAAEAKVTGKIEWQV